MSRHFPLGSIFEVEDILTLSWMTFEETCEEVLQGAVRALGADLGALVLWEGDTPQKVAAHPSWEACEEIPFLQECSYDFLSSPSAMWCGAQGEAEASLSLLGNFLAVKLQCATVVAKKNPQDRRRQTFQELGRFFGYLYLERETPFSQEEQQQVAAYIPHAALALRQSKIYERLTRDPLTGFFTKCQLPHLLEAETSLADKLNSSLALLLLDIVHFESLNLTFGEAQGDQILRELAKLLRRSLRREDLPIRYGGDQFLFLLPHTGKEEAKIVVRRLQREVEKYPFLQGQVQLHLRGGISLYPLHGRRPDLLAECAEKALYAAKKERIPFLFYSPLLMASPATDHIVGLLSGDPARDQRRVSLLLDAILAVNAVLELPKLLTVILDMMVEITHGERALLFLYPTSNPQEGPPEQVLCQNARGEEIDPVDYLSEVVEKVRRHKRPMTSEDPLPPSLQEEMERLGVASFLCVPLTSQGKLIGVAYVDSQERRTFERQDRIFFHALAKAVGLAIEKARLYEEKCQAQKELEQLKQKLQRQAKRKRGKKQSSSSSPPPLQLYEEIVGCSPPLQEVLNTLKRIQDSDIPVLIIGESGTGKELIARAIHATSRRREAEFVSINCAAMTESLLESELFGYVKGAFTGAEEDKVGLFELANGGTLFLDEVGDMGEKMQKELLRVLQEGEIRPVGSREIRKVDVRIIAATNRNLQHLMREGQFREDLYYRLNVVEIYLPPLRERQEDIPLLAEKFLQEFSQRTGSAEKTLSPKALEKLTNYSWPGNIRELRNVLERSALLCPYEVLDAEDILLPEHTATSHPYSLTELLNLPYQEAKDLFICWYLEEVLRRENYNVTRAAKRAGILRTSLHKMLKKFDISIGADER